MHADGYCNLAWCMLAVSVLGVGVSVGGCGSRALERRPEAAVSAAPKPSANLVFAPSDIWTGEVSPDDARLNESLSARSDSVAFDQWAWPGPVRPSLDRSRRLVLPTNPGTFTYFRVPRTDWHRHGENGAWVVP